MTNVSDGKAQLDGPLHHGVQVVDPVFDVVGAGADVDAVGLPDERLRVHAGQYSECRGARPT